MTVRFGPVAKICQLAINGRFWSKADVPATDSRGSFRG
jgi:hypothetical protein